MKSLDQKAKKLSTSPKKVNHCILQNSKSHYLKHYQLQFGSFRNLKLLPLTLFAWNSSFAKRISNRCFQNHLLYHRETGERVLHFSDINSRNNRPRVAFLDQIVLPMQFVVRSFQWSTTKEHLRRVVTFQLEGKHNRYCVLVNDYHSHHPYSPLYTLSLPA